MRSARLLRTTLMVAVMAISFTPVAIPAQDSPPIVDTFQVLDTLAFGPTDTMTADTTRAGGIPVPDTRAAINWLLTILMTLATPKIMTSMERMSQWLTARSPTVKQLVVAAIPAVVMYIASVCTHFWPWFAWEPSLQNVFFAGVGAWGLHAGAVSKIANQKSTAALQVANQTREMQGR